MRSFESNHRYLMYSAGFHYIVEFNTRLSRDRDLYGKLVKAFTNTFGPDKFQVEVERQSGGKHMVWRGSDDWRTEYRPSMKRKRIYLKDGSPLTMAMLQIS